MTDIENFNLIYNFSNKLLVSIKTKNNILSQEDYLIMLKNFPEAYKLSDKLYQNKNKNAILTLLTGALLLDMKLLNLTIDNIAVKEIGNLITKDIPVLIENLTDDLIERLGDGTVIPSEINTGIYVSAFMISISTYLKQIKNNVPLGEITVYDYMTFYNEYNNSNNDSLISLSEDVVGFTPSAYSMLDFLYRKAIIKFTSMVNDKRLKENTYNKLPNINMLSCYPLTLGMIYNSTMFE